MGDRFPSRQPSSASRRRSEDGRPSSRFSGSLRQDNDFDMEQFGISDGFAPPSSTNIPTQTQYLTSDRPSTRRPLSLNAPTNAPPSRSSTYKQPRQQGGRSSFALGYDGLGDHIPRRAPSMAASTTSNETRSTDSTFVLPTQTPFQGPSRPTHPYAMYPQGTGLSSRPSSIMTTSTVRIPERAFVGASGPTHPYGMYPQSTVPEAADNENSVPVLSFPVGFPGHGQDYQRRLGPDGEEAADIIGPDGHTEQLPPYSKYPTDVRLKGHSPANSEVGARSSAAPSTAVPEYNPSHSQASLNPNVQQSRLSTRSFMSESSEARLRPTGTCESDKSGSLKERLSEKGRKRVCCGKVPLWCILAVLVILGVLFLGGIIGGMMARRHIQNDMASGAEYSVLASMTYVATITTTIEAAPLTATPPSLPPMPTGTFALPASEQQGQGCTNACLTRGWEYNTWGCEISSGRFQDLQLQITPDLGGMIQLTALNNGTGSLRYGAQVPAFSEPQRTTLVMDKDDPSKGPAYHFEVIYNKLVILKEDDFTPNTVSGRDVDGDVEAREAQLTPPWWPLNLPPPTNFPRPHGGGYESPSSSSRKSPVELGDKPWYCWWNSTILQGFIYTSVNISPTNTTWNDSSAGSAPTTAGASAPTATTCPTFPKVVKIAEFRNPTLSSYVPAYCTKMQVLDNGQIVPAIDVVGQYVLHEWVPNGSNSNRLLKRHWYDDTFGGLGRRILKGRSGGGESGSSGGSGDSGNSGSSGSSASSTSGGSSGGGGGGGGGGGYPFCRCQWMNT